MKKKFLGAAITAALIIISCSKSDFEEEQRQTPIMFTPLIEQNTRAIISGTTYPTTETFNVTAYYKPSGGSYNFANAGKYLDNMQISYVTTGSAWKSTGGTYYWPPQGALKFIATSPYGAVTPSYDSTNGIQFPSFRQGTTPVDLMYAESANDLTSGSVALTFKHALTQLYFTIKIQAVLGLASCRIKKIDVLNVCNGGSFKALPTPTWTKTEGSNSIFNVYDNATGTLLAPSDPAYEFPNRLLLIPQSVSGIVIRITYDYTTLLGLVTLGTTKNVTLSGNAWQPNQRIKYAITITQLL